MCDPSGACFALCLFDELALKCSVTVVAICTVNALLSAMVRGGASAPAVCLREVWCQAFRPVPSLTLQTYYEFLPKALYKDER